MAITHDTSTTTGKELCESLFKLLAAQIPSLELKTLKRGCAFVEPGHPKLCYIFHFKKLNKIQIWPYFDYLQVDQLKQVVGNSGLPVTPRNSIAGMARLYPLPVQLQTQADVDRAVGVLLFAISAKNQGGRKSPAEPKDGTIRQHANHAITLADEILEPDAFPEGGRKTIIVNAYERSAQARHLCIKHYGFICCVCGLDFEQKYGPLGKGFIHVHHIFKISKIGKKYTVDPKKDLRLVCPNCHAMLHRRDPAFGIEELSAMMRPSESQ
ncbi:MAG TPA: HNH endonuclease [Terracidiphilus sp.]|jgi:5-methylcytosine-specific restriction protein A